MRILAIRRLDAVLEPTKHDVLHWRQKLDDARITNQDAALRQTAGPTTPEVTGEVRKLLRVFNGEIKRQELQDELRLKHEDHFRKAYLIPALISECIEMTIPDKPQSSKQKYRLTKKGHDVLSRKSNS